MTKARKRRKPEQFVKALAEGEAMLAAGKTTAEVCQKLGVVESNWMRWKKQFGGMKSNEARRLRELEIENQRLNEPACHSSTSLRLARLVIPDSKISSNLMSAFSTGFSLPT